MWVYKTYKTRYREKDEELADSLDRTPIPTDAVLRRLEGLAIPIDLGKHRDRQLFGYCYLEYVKNEHL
jgi:hypothetical protein